MLFVCSCSCSCQMLCVHSHSHGRFCHSPISIVVACLIFINKLKNKITRLHSQAGLLPGVDRQRRTDGLLDIWLLLHPILHHGRPAELFAQESLPNRYDIDRVRGDQVRGTSPWNSRHRSLHPGESISLYKLIMQTQNPNRIHIERVYNLKHSHTPNRNKKRSMMRPSLFK